MRISLFWLVEPVVLLNLRNFQNGLSRYSDYIRFREGLAAVCIIDESRAYGVKYGFIDENDNTIIPFIYDYAQNFINGKARVLLNSEEYFINKNGDRISKKLKREIIR